MMSSLEEERRGEKREKRGERKRSGVL